MATVTLAQFIEFRERFPLDRNRDVPGQSARDEIEEAYRLGLMSRQPTVMKAIDCKPGVCRFVDLGSHCFYCAACNSNGGPVRNLDGSVRI